MLRPVLVAGILFGIVVALAGQTKYGVTVTAEKNVDFSKFKTYTWTKMQPAATKTVDAQITAAVDRELSALGMSKAATGTGDVLVTYASLSRTDLDLKAKPNEKGLKPEHAVGTLVVDLLEPGSRRRLLRLRSDRPIDTEPDKLEAAINSAVAELFAKYPTRTQKK